MLRALPAPPTAGVPLSTRILHQQAGGLYYYPDPASMRVYQPLDAHPRDDGGESASSGLYPSRPLDKVSLLSSGADPREPRAPQRSYAPIQDVGGVRQPSRRSRSLDSRLGGLSPKERRTAELVLGSPVRGRSISNGRDPLEAPSFLSTEQGRRLYSQDQKEANEVLRVDLEQRASRPIPLALDFGLSGRDSSRPERIIAYSESIAPYPGAYSGPYVLSRHGDRSDARPDSSDGEEGGELPSSQHIHINRSDEDEAFLRDPPSTSGPPVGPLDPRPPPAASPPPPDHYDSLAALPRPRAGPVPVSQWRQRADLPAAALDDAADAAPRARAGSALPGAAAAPPAGRSRSAPPRRTAVAFSDIAPSEDDRLASRSTRPAMPLPVRGPSPVRGRPVTRGRIPEPLPASAGRLDTPYASAGSERGTESATASVTAGRQPSPAARRRSRSTPSQLALAAEADRTLTHSMARALRQAELANLDLSSVQLSVAASSRLEQARQQMEALLQKHDAEFDRAVKLLELQKEQERFVHSQLVKLNVITGQRTADRDALRVKAKRAAEAQTAQRLQADAERRRIRERHEQLVEEWRDELLLREELEQDRMRQRKREQEEERLRRRIAAQERAEYIHQVNVRNQLMIQDKADRTYCDILCRQHDKVKAERLAQLKERARLTNQYKETRHRLARELQDQEVESLRVQQCVKDWEQAQVDEEIERMRRIVKEDRRNLDRALEQLRREG